MANLGRNRSYGKVKPVVGSTINWGHPLAKGLVGCWLMNERRGNKVRDISNHGNHGTNIGVNWKSSILGNSLDFDGTDSAVDCGTGSSIHNLGPLTFVTLFNMDTFGEGSLARLFDTKNAAGRRLFVHNSSSQKAIQWSVDYVTTDLGKKSVDNSLDTGIWTHFALTWDGGLAHAGVHMYKNGIELAYSSNPGETFDASGDIVSDSGGVFYIGNNTSPSGTRTFDGRIVFVYMYNRVLIQSEVVALYKSPYQFIQSNRMSRYFFPAAVAGGVSLNQVERRQPRGLMRGVARGVT